MGPRRDLLGLQCDFQGLRRDFFGSNVIFWAPTSFSWIPSASYSGLDTFWGPMRFGCFWRHCWAPRVIIHVRIVLRCSGFICFGPNETVGARYDLSCPWHDFRGPGVNFRYPRLSVICGGPGRIFWGPYRDFKIPRLDSYYFLGGSSCKL